MEKREDQYLEVTRLTPLMFYANMKVMDRLDNLLPARRMRSAKIRQLIADFVEAEEAKQKNKNSAA
jgi:hypothetical protein